MNLWNERLMMNRKVFLAWLVVVCAVFTMSLAQARELPDFTDIVTKTSPAVVNISTSQTVKQHPQIPHGLPQGPEGSPPLDDFFRRFFGDPGRGGGGGGGGDEDFSTQSLGSGFIISSDGYILTNDHVIKDADKIIVRLNDRQEYEAKVVGSDTRSDVALLKIDAKNLPTVEIGHSSKLKVGEWVLAIGSPLISTIR